MNRFWIVALLLAACCCKPAGAQTNWSYNPFTGSATWLGAANVMMYPFDRYAGGSMPLYLADPVIWSGAYYANKSLTNGFRQFSYGNYTSDDGMMQPRQRTRPVVSRGNAVVDQIAHAQPYSSNQAMPPLAPPLSRFPLAPPQLSSASRGFIELVNTKYGGNISKALFDPSARSYARSIGLISSDEIFDADLSPQKVETIKEIFADEKEDPTARVNAARLLLKH